MPENLTDRRCCHKCNMTVTGKRKLSKCAQCHSITYCGQECQREDWPRHSQYCIPVMVTEIPGKGRGLVASKDFKKGQIIFKDTAAITIKAPSYIVPLHELKEQISKLSEEQKSKFYQLTPHAVGKLIPTQVTSALRENCLKEFTLFVNNCTGLNIDKDTLYLFINSSLLNHSCAPNATVEKCGDDLQHNKVIAIKDISKGEEVTESYLEGLELKTKTQMRTELQADCSFDCKCGVCTGSIPDQDGIISKIKQLVPSPTNPIVCTPITHNLRLERAAELTKQLYVGRFHARIAVLEQFVYASQRARDPIRLKKAVEFMKEEIGVRMMESSIFGNCYKILQTKLER